MTFVPRLGKQIWQRIFMTPSIPDLPVVEAVPTPPPLPVIPLDPAEILDQLPKRIRHVQAEVAKVVVGQEAAVLAMLYALFSRVHCLLVGVPGLAKTLLAKHFPWQPGDSNQLPNKVVTA